MYLTTCSGKEIHFINPDPKDLDIKDLAWAAAHINRWCGHANRPWSIAQHQLFVARNMPKTAAIYGLIHDLHETVTNDIPAPVKRYVAKFTSVIKDIEDNFDIALRTRYDIPEPSAAVLAEIKILDGIALSTERRDIFNAPLTDWWKANMPKYSNEIIYPSTATPSSVADNYVEWFYRYLEALHMQSLQGK